MITVSNDFKTEVKGDAKQLSAFVKWGLNEMTSEDDLKSIKIISEGDIASTVIRECQITHWGDSNLLGDDVNVGIGVMTPESAYEWRVPSDTDFTNFTDYVNGYQSTPPNYDYRYNNTNNAIGKSLANTSGWNANATAGNVGNDQASNNATRFTAKPGGVRLTNGSSFGLGTDAYFWSSTASSATHAWSRFSASSFVGVYRNSSAQAIGCSVRLVRDDTGSDADGTIYANNYTGNDGKKYDGVKIGDWVFTLQNLKETKYADGTDIPEITDDTDWGSDTDGAWCKHSNDSDNYDEYGALYNFHAVNNAKGIVSNEGAEEVITYTPEYIDYGTFKIQKIEQRKGAEQIVATGYDKMYEALRRYDLSTPYPATLKKYIEAICTRLGWELGTSSFLNDDLVLEADLYSFQNFTFRDVLDQIAEVTCSVIRFGIDDKLYIQELKTVVDEAVTTSELRTLDIENKWGAINSVVFTENPVERNFVSVGGYYNPPILLENGEELLLENGEPYLSNRLIEIDDLWQIRYTNNLILGEDREGLIGDIATELTGKEFYPFTAKTIGLGYFEVGDLITLEDLQGTQYQTYVMSVTVELSGSGFKDSLGMVEPRKSRSNYKKEAGVITKELIDSQLGESNIEDGAVSTAKIRDASITNAKIENLGADKITTGTLNVDTTIIINDGVTDRILIGYQEGGF